MSFFGFGQSAELELVLSDSESRRRTEHKTEEGKKEKYFLFYDGETVSGRVILTLKHPNKRLEHQGIKVEFIGQIGKKDGGRVDLLMIMICSNSMEPPYIVAVYLGVPYAMERGVGVASKRRRRRNASVSTWVVSAPETFPGSMLETEC